LKEEEAQKAEERGRRGSTEGRRGRGAEQKEEEASGQRRASSRQLVVQSINLFGLSKTDRFQMCGKEGGEKGSVVEVDG